MEKGTLVGELCQRISDLVSETTYKKPKKWAWGVIITSALAAGGVSGYFINNHFSSSELQAVRQNAGAEAEKKEKEYSSEINALQGRFTQATHALSEENSRLEEQIKEMQAAEPEKIKTIRRQAEQVEQERDKVRGNLEKANKSIARLKKENSGLQDDLQKTKREHKEYVSGHSYTNEEYAAALNSAKDFEKRLSEAVKDLARVNREFRQYRKSHPEHITSQAFGGLQDQLRIAIDQLKEKKEEHDAYVKSHPYTREHCDAVRARAVKAEKRLAEVEKQVKALEDYQKEHLHSNSEYRDLEKEKKLLTARVQALDKKVDGLLEGYFETLSFTDSRTGEKFLYFDIPYGREMPSADILEKAGDWAGPKRIGRYITRDVAARFDADDILMEGYSGRFKNDFDQLWVKLGGSGKEFRYLLVIEKGSERDVHEIKRKDVQAFMENCFKKK